MIVEQRIRKVFQPLRLAIMVDTSGVSTTQVVNQYEGTVTPERKNEEGKYTILRPIVIANTGSNDPSWTDGNCAHLLTEVKWLANGIDISIAGTAIYDAFHNAGSALYDIVSSNGDDNGSLRLWKNLAAEESYAMTMNAKFLDSRTGKTYEVKTDIVDLTAKAKGEDEWDFSIVHEVNIQYNPLLDKLKEYDWLVAKGENPNKQDYMDATAYDLTLPILVTKGHDKYTPDEHITFELLDHLDDHKSLSDASWLTEFDKTKIRIDQRKLPHKTMVVDVVMKVDGVVQSQEQLTFSRLMPAVHIDMQNDSDIDMGSATRWEKAVVTFNGREVRHPEAYLAIEWGARSSDADAWTEQGYGEQINIDQDNLNVKACGRDTLYVRMRCYAKTGVNPLSNDDVIKDVSNSAIVVASLATKKNKVYTPLSIATSIQPSGKPLVQIDGDSTTQRTEDNPLVLTPVVIANSKDSDPTWTDGNCNALLTDINWYANGVNVSSVFSGQYSISNENDATKGTLKLWHNCKGYETHSLYMEAKLTDSRTGQQYKFQTDSIEIMSQTPQEDEWDFSIVHDVNIRYSPLLDKLKEYDWLVAKGKLTDNDTNRLKYLDSTAYELRLPLFITHGHFAATDLSNVTFRLFYHKDGGELTDDDGSFVKSISTSALQFDLRYMTEETMVIDVQMFVDGVFQSQEQLTFSRYYPNIVIETMNKSDIDLGAKSRWDKALVMFNGRRVDNPEAFLLLEWEARSGEGQPWVAQGSGEEVTIMQDNLNLTNELYIRVGYRIKSGLSLALLVNSEGKFITNSDGKYIVIENFID